MRVLREERSKSRNELTVKKSLLFRRERGNNGIEESEENDERSY